VRFGRRATAALALALAISALSAQAAFATFHEMVVREVYPGSTTSPEAEYVELQMYASGQNFVDKHTITVYNSAGKQVASAEFLADVKNGANQATIVAATSAAESAFGIAADVALSPAGAIDPAGGAVCWESLDCVSWGNFSGSAQSPTGSPAVPGGIPDGQALRRTIAPGCASLLEASDDHDNSAADLEAVFPGPRPNSVAPTEKSCGGQGGGGAGGGQGGGGGKEDVPQTTLRAKPAKRTRDRTPTFRFGSSDRDANFQCKIDGKPFKACRSPFTTKKLAFGKHTFKVRARGRGGEVDPSPALFAFTVLKPR
jgi:methionine-rich copper-binding protein CopC